MPLSEQEQRLLDEMERHLLNGDADVVSAPVGGRELSYRNLVLGAVIFIVGIGALIFGVSLGELIGTVIGVVGFGAIFGGVVLALTPASPAKDEPRMTPSAAEPKRPSASFMDRMNDRWEKRNDGR